jgi:transposase
MLTTGHGAVPIRRVSSTSMPPDRKAERPIAHLDDFKGVLQVDGKLAERGDVQLAFCWAHMRCNFYELATPGPAPIASEAFKRIAEFYAIEKDIRDRSAEERRLIRQQKSQPLATARSTSCFPGQDLKAVA